SVKLISIPDTVKVSVAEQTGNPVIDVDGDQIVQVISNLVSNAVAAMPNGGELKIGASGDDSHIRITVEDTGIGISEQNAKKVFEPFFTTKQMGRGTGLGLAVAYGIVKMHRGSITLESNAKPEAGPTGTIFTVTLPRSVAQTEETI
ncbi:MAG TPA: HAMP domain-containing sensor histidine kinase, partial [Kiritimatiellia bacterium]|nr:HAMP domain-containing sensor histidine kinase [Kiritimatiellia bacterium]